MPAPAVVLWDRAEEPPTEDAEVLLWRKYAGGESQRSVPGYLEAHAERIRNRYLCFIHDLGQSPLNGRRLVEQLQTADGYNFWWMSTVAEKSPLKSPRIYDCLRLLALQEMLDGRRPRLLRLCSSDSVLAASVRALCVGLDARFEWQPSRGHESIRSLRRLYAVLPYWAKGLLSLRLVPQRWSLRRLADPAWYSGERAIFIASYFIHLDSAQGAQGRFHSRQWEALPELLQTYGRRLNWLQLFLFSAAVPTVDAGVQWARAFNADAGHQGCHSFLDSSLSVAVVLRALKRWLWLRRVCRQLRTAPAAFTVRGSTLTLWPMLRDDWYRSLGGQIGMINCLMVEQFDALLARIPHQRTGLYLCENQAWEKALLRAWRRHGHGHITGVQHATAPFWHLYYFDDPRSLAATTATDMPLPDRLAVNGEVAWNEFVAAGYPRERLVPVEALRYLSLATIARDRSCASRPPAAQTLLRILVLGDMIPSSVRHLLELTAGAVKGLQGTYRLSFKAHPGYRINVADYPELALHETFEPLAGILAGYDVVIAANSTSASVDAYVAGLPVIIALDGDALNLSPLRGQPHVRFVSSSLELAAVLLELAAAPAMRPAERGQFFFLDPELPRWRRLLGLDRSADTP